MKYIALKNGDRISALTLGVAGLHRLAEPEAVQLIKTAKKHGVDCMDMYAENAQAFVYAQEAIKGSAEALKLIIHFGVDYSRGDVRYVTQTDEILNSVTAQMQTLRIDRLDYACLDCPRGLADLEAARTGVFPMMQELKKAGVIHELCAYTENPAETASLLDTGYFAFVMVNNGTSVVICEEAGRTASELRSPADLVELHNILKEYKV